LVLQDSYVSMLSRVIALAAFDGRVIIVGRGGNLVLPPDDGIRVRVVAPRALRLAALAEREGLDRKAAGVRLDEVDHSRAEFVRRQFHADLRDATFYDLVIDSARFGLGGSAELIYRALELRGLLE
jgi:cytidylate kinase